MTRTAYVVLVGLALAALSLLLVLAYRRGRRDVVEDVEPMFV